MRASTVRRKKHPPKKEKTRSITYRFPEKLVEELEAESMEKNISQNVLVKQILEKYVQWDRFSSKIGMIPVPKGILESLGFIYKTPARIKQMGVPEFVGVSCFVCLFVCWLCSALL